MIELTSSEVFKITEENNKFELYKFPDSKSGGISYEQVKVEIEKELASDITATDSQDEIIGPIIIDQYRQQVTKRMKNDKYMKILAIYNSSIFEDFESFQNTS